MAEVTQALTSHIKACLDRIGFVAVPELFENAAMIELREILDRSIHPIAGRGDHNLARLIERCEPCDESQFDLTEVFYPSSLEPRILSTRVFRRCAELARALDRGYELYFDSLITKTPHSQHSVFWHRDANFSPAKRLRAAFMPRAHFWLPIHDVTPANGRVQFVRGSHKEQNVLHLHEERIVANSILAGGLTIHLPETLHYSAPNITAQPRSAWLMTFGRFGSVKLGLKKLFKRVPAAMSPSSKP
jgi:hypothetical protein